MYHLLIEAIIVGAGLVVMGLVITTLYFKYIKDVNEMYKLCRELYRDNTLMIIFFISGFLFHIFCEITNINKWYCKNGNACL